jgi:hypothetical protein
MLPCVYFHKAIEIIEFRSGSYDRQPINKAESSFRRMANTLISLIITNALVSKALARK